jgi:hypothetical protein
VSRIWSHSLTNQTQFNLEFELRLQQYIEMIRTGDRGKLIDAMAHAKRYLTPYTETQSKEIHRAAGLLAFPQDTKAEPYKVHTSNPCPQIRPLCLKYPANRFLVDVLIRPVESPV